MTNFDKKLPLIHTSIPFKVSRNNLISDKQKKFNIHQFTKSKVDETNFQMIYANVMGCQVPPLPPRPPTLYIDRITTK